jgi:membrane protein DedA with SNARE-associated domain
VRLPGHFCRRALESAALVGLFIPGETLVLVTGFLAAQGVLDLDILLMMVTLGVAVGDSIGNEMERWLGWPGLLHYGRHAGLTDAHVAKAEAFFGRHGSKAVFLGRFISFAKALAWLTLCLVGIHTYWQHRVASRHRK